jgi:hypothetical protein
MNVVNLVSPVFSAWPGYNYSGMNEVQVTWDQHADICLGYVNVTLYLLIGNHHLALIYNSVNPTVLTLYPNSGPTTGGTIVSIWANTGASYDLSLNYSCLFGNQSDYAPATVVDSEHILCASPSMEPGTYEIYVKVLQNGYSLDSGLAFRYYSKHLFEKN